jgi:hypothetical protein
MKRLPEMLFAATPSCGLSRSLAQFLLIFVGIDLKPHLGTEWSGFRLPVEFLFALESSYQRRDA